MPAAPAAAAPPLPPAAPPPSPSAPAARYQFAQAHHTWPADPADPVDWRQGRTRYTVWLLPIDDAAGDSATETATEAPHPGAPGRRPAVADSVARRLATVRAALPPEWLLTGPRQPHITLQVCGFRVPHPARHADDFDPAQQAAQWQALQALRTRAPQAVRPFTLHIGGPDSFESAVFLRVADPGGALAPLRRALALHHGEFRSAATPWVPHLTVGLYRQAVPTAAVARALDAASAAIGPTPLALTVRRLLRVDYDARELQGPLDLAGAEVFDLEA